MEIVLDMSVILKEVQTTCCDTNGDISHIKLDNYVIDLISNYRIKSISYTNCLIENMVVQNIMDVLLTVQCKNLHFSTDGHIIIDYLDFRDNFAILIKLLDKHRRITKLHITINQTFVRMPGEHYIHDNIERFVNTNISIRHLHIDSTLIMQLDYYGFFYNNLTITSSNANLQNAYDNIRKSILRLPHFETICKNNNVLRQINNDRVFTIFLMFMCCQVNIFHTLNKDVVKIIATYVFDQKYDRSHLTKLYNTLFIDN